MVLHYSCKRGVGLWELTLVMLVLVNLAAEGARRHRKPPVWLNPYKTNDYWKGKNRGSHEPHERNHVSLTGRGQRASPRPLRRLRMQVMITWNHINSFPSLSKIICNKVSSLGPIIRYDWLPSNQSFWYRKHVKCMDKKSKVTMLLPKLQDGLQRFSASFDKLKSYRSGLGLTFECRTRRQKVLDEISAKLNQLLYEVEKTMVDLKMQNEMAWLDEEVADSFMPDYGKDMTTTQLYDWGIISSYEIYIAEWQKIIRQVVGPKGNAKCDRNHHNKLKLPLN
ncbi:uncharacterized protein LOC106670540 [Cimex lectularius]|uniref:Uncharacterized protein n=1 Tax=Cimex lectularius TaxID=79782 RepID=A0A8I6SME5_CIMLE|nr:uncharacterized protein LOC106670540 [Cimex lectularius]